MDHSELVSMARETAEAAGKLLREKWRQPRTLTAKGFRDIVTDADIAAQRLITEQILAAFPNHGFLAEEEDASLAAAGEIIWIVDPVDGTTNYSRQIPDFSVSVAAAQPQDAQLTVVAAAVYDPLRAELFWAGQGAGAWLNSIPLTVSTTNAVADAVIAVDWARQPEVRAQTLAALNKLAPEVRTVRAIGTAALALAWVAAGRLDGYLNIGLHAWDSAAAQLLISEAGGRVTDLVGHSWNPAQRACLASNGRLHPDLHRLADPTTANS